MVKKKVAGGGGTSCHVAGTCSFILICYRMELSFYLFLVTLAVPELTTQTRLASDSDLLALPSEFE